MLQNLQHKARFPGLIDKSQIVENAIHHRRFVDCPVQNVVEDVVDVANGGLGWNECLV